MTYVADLFILEGIQIDESIHQIDKSLNGNKTINEAMKDTKLKEISEITYEITGEYNNSFENVAENQGVLTKEDGSIYLIIGTTYDKNSFEKVTDEDIVNTTKYRSKNWDLNTLAYAKIEEQIKYYNLKNPNAKIIKEIDDFTAKEIITVLLDWTYLNINQISKIEEITDPYEILKSKEGDCTEISDLFAALLKSILIPARTVTGYAGGIEDGGFFGHQWNEVAIEGKWVAVDPTWNMFIKNSIHHIKTNENDSYNNRIKKFKLRPDTIRYRDSTKIYFNKDGQIRYR